MNDAQWRHPKLLTLVAMAIATVMLLAVACAGDDDEVASQQQPAAADQPAAAAAAADPAAPAAATGTTATTSVSGGAMPAAPSAVAQAQFEAFPQDGMPQYGGILHVSEGTLGNLDFIREHTEASSGEPGGMIYENLLRWDFAKLYSGEAYQVAPGLAKSWEISDDGTVFTFPLRDDVQWHDGTPFTCADVKATYDFLIDVPGDFHASGEGYIKPFVETTQCPDTYTLVLNLRGPAPSLLENLAYQWTFLVPKHKLEGEADNWFLLNALGTGPFTWDSDKWERGIRWSVTANPDYWEEGIPYLGGVLAFELSDTGSQLAAMETRRIDLTAAGSPDQQDAILSRAGGRVSSNLAASASVSYFLYNVRKPPFDDPKVRQALYLWIDRQPFVDKARDGKGFVREWLNPEWSNGYGTSYEDLVKNNLAYNPDKTEARKRAMELLAEAGYTDLSKYKIQIVSRYTSGGGLEGNQLLAAQLKDMGWDAELISLERIAGVQALKAGDYNAAYYGGHAGMPLPDAPLNRQLGADGDRNYTGYIDPVYEKLRAAYNTNADPVRKAQILSEIDAHLQLGTQAVQVASWGRQDAIQWSYVHGYEWLRGCCGHPNWRVWLGDDAPGRN